MPITPEEGQKVADLRSRMMENLAAKRPAWDGVSKEELHEGLAILRNTRGKVTTAAAKTKGGKKAKASADLSDLFAALGLSKTALEGEPPTDE